MRSDDYLDDGDERDRFSTGAIFASGWFRAVLVLGVLAITLVVTVPYLLRWMEPGQPRTDRQVARSIESRPAVAPTPIPVPAPVAPAATSPASTPAPAQSTATPAPPAAATPAPAALPAPAATATPAPKMTAPAVASGPVTERLVPAPAPAQMPSAQERESSPVKPGVAGADARKAEPAAKKAAAHEPAPAKASAPPGSRGGEYWVQVGAFQRERNAEALVRSIRESLKMPVQMSRPARAEAVSAAPSRHEVFVTGTPVATVNAALRGQGTAQAVRGGVAVHPPLELKEAIALSQRLAGEGMNVKVRRVGGDAPPADAQIAYVVRVGGYATRAQAEAARRELARKNVNGFVTPAAHTAQAPPARVAHATPVAHTPAAK